MTDQADMEARAMERWPGYSEQSWQQRFIELDRRHAEMHEQLIRFAQVSFEREVAARKDERAAAYARAGEAARSQFENDRDNLSARLRDIARRDIATAIEALGEKG